MKTDVTIVVAVELGANVTGEFVEDELIACLSDLYRRRIIKAYRIGRLPENHSHSRRA